MPALLAVYPRETVNEIAAVQELSDHLGNYRTQEAERMREESRQNGY